MAFYELSQLGGAGQRERMLSLHLQEGPRRDRSPASAPP